MRTFNGLQIFTEQLTNSGQLDARYIIKNEVLGPQGQADFGIGSSIQALSVGGVIAGGEANSIGGSFGSIGGGTGNIADAYAFVGGGYNNQAIDDFVFIGGGSENIAGSVFSFIGNGCCNFISIRPQTGPGSNNAPSPYSSIINGTNNTLDGYWSFIGGGLENSITGAGLFAFNNILGGWSNSICDSEMSSIVGGRMNLISGQNLAQATPDFIGGGCQNKAYNHGNFIGGGQNNTTNCYGTILNGSDNTICDSYASIILGGAGNLVSGYNGEEEDPDFIGGGFENKAYNHGNFIGGGFENIANSYGIIVGGASNYAESSASVVGGTNNQARRFNSFIGNGLNNLISGGYSFIGGGLSNEIQSADATSSFIGGGDGNKIRGAYSFIGGGISNEVRANHSYIIGGRCSIVNTSHCGAAILGDGQDRIHNSSGPHTLTLDFASGIFIKNKTILENSYIPSTSTSPGTSGQIATDSNYFYSHNGIKWRRTALSEW